MELHNIVKGIVTRLDSVESEAAVRQAVVNPILDALDWDTRQTDVVVPEYPIDGRYVDYALLVLETPYVFIETKRPGGVNTEGQIQLFNYATNRGVPILVLTDGNQWKFYLSMAAGDPSERLFYSMELRNEKSLDDSIDFLGKCLKRDEIRAGTAKLLAEELHQKKLQPAKLKQAIEKVWTNVLRDENNLIVDYLIEEVTKESRINPGSDDILEFLRNLSTPNTSNLTPRTEPSTRPSRRRLSNVDATGGGRIVGFQFEEQTRETHSGMATLVEILRLFSSRDQDFLNRLEIAAATKTRKLVSKNRNSLFQRKDMVERHSKILGGGWYIGGNLSSGGIRKHVQTACEVAGVKYPKDLKLIEN